MIPIRSSPGNEQIISVPLRYQKKCFQFPLTVFHRIFLTWHHLESRVAENHTPRLLIRITHVTCRPLIHTLEEKDSSGQVGYKFFIAPQNLLFWNHLNSHTLFCTVLDAFLLKTDCSTLKFGKNEKTLAQQTSWLRKELSVIYLHYNPWMHEALSFLHFG